MHIQFRLLALSAFLLFATPALAASTAALPAVPAALAGRVNDIDLDADRKSVALAIDELLGNEEHEGLLGFTLHPEFGMGKNHDFVYVAFSHAVKDKRSKIVLYHWDAEAGTLGDPVDLAPDGTWAQGDGYPRELAFARREGQDSENHREGE